MSLPDLPAIQQRAHDWANKNLPNRTEGSSWMKLFEEIGEVIKEPSDALEWADVQIILLDLASMYRIDLNSAIDTKMAILQGRKWRQSEAGVYSHEPNSAETAVALAKSASEKIADSGETSYRRVFIGRKGEVVSDNEALGLLGVPCHVYSPRLGDSSFILVSFDLVGERWVAVYHESAGKDQCPF